MARRAKTARVAADRVPTREEILAFVRSAREKVGKREIARAFHLKGSQRRELRELLNDMAQDGLLTGDRKELREPGGLPPVTILDIVRFDQDGELLGEPVVWETREGPRPLVLLATSANVAAGKHRPSEAAPGIGDRVLTRITPLDDGNAIDGVRFSGTVIKRLPREKRRLLGIFRAHAAGGGEIAAVERKSAKSWPVQAGDEEDATEGDLVRFDIAQRGHSGLPRARVIEVLGNPNDQHQISLIAVHNHGIPDEFPETVMTELDALPALNPDGRSDLRQLPLLTIDPATARDHDDAVHAQADPDPANDGGWIVTVAIADVAHYVRPGTRLDREAQKRGNSVYFPDRVVPMLPEAISNDLCSLREAEDRPCLAVRMVFDRSGTKRSHTFLRALMRSAIKLSYEEAQSAFDGSASERSEPLLKTVLEPLHGAYQALSKARDKRQPLELELPERRIVLDDAGQVERVVVPERLDAHRLIEEFMIQANVAAAETLEKHKTPLIYRVHDQPSKAKLSALRDFFQSLDIKFHAQGTIRPEIFNRILIAAKSLPTQDLVNEVILRAQAQAEYAPDNYGHFGLNLRRYAHFTSPIRRYADLIVHRALIRALKLGSDGLEDREIEDLQTIGEHISQTERRAMTAERETTDRLIAAHLADRVGAEFQGRISGMTRSGLFVRLHETGADGFIPASTLDDDYYHYIEDQHALIGESTNLMFRLGDIVDVRLREAIPMAGALRFEMLSTGTRGHPSLMKGWRGRTNAHRRRRRR
ncbi:MAG: ribonuclease R [Hyphomicrobiaceae bacterium]